MAKRVVSTALIVFVFAAVAYLIATEVMKSPAAESPAEVAAEPQPAAGPDAPVREQVTLYLFHGRYRCWSCNVMEDFVTKALDQGFAEELGSGRVVFRSINVEDPQYRSYIDNYRLRSISVVISRTEGGFETRWDNLEQVWSLLRNERAFIEYIQSQVSAYLAAGGRG